MVRIPRASVNVEEAKGAHTAVVVAAGDPLSIPALCTAVDGADTTAFSQLCIAVSQAKAEDHEPLSPVVMVRRLGYRRSLYSSMVT